MSSATAGPASNPAPGPVTAGERIVAIDVVRGLAVLGILVMNIVEFAWPFEAYDNPAYAAGSSGADLWTWYAQVAFFDGKMRALFSMLFGAGLVLISERMVAKGRTESSADLLLRRCLWLVLFGIVHRFGLQWSGDILYQYGLLGLIAIAFRNLRAKTLIVLGVCTLTAFVPIGFWGHAKSTKLRTQAEQAVSLEKAGEKVSDELAAARKRWETRLASVPPKAEDITKEVTAMRGGYLEVFAHRWDYHNTFQSAYLYYYFVWDVLGMMFLGMGLMKIGFFAGRSPASMYLLFLVAGAAAAFGVLLWARAWKATGFSPGALDLQLWKQTTYSYSRAIVGLAWASGLLLMVRAGRAQHLTSALGAVGRMAFSNYVLQTVCCTLLFFGYGFGFYGKVSRSWLMLVVAGVTMLQIAFSSAWLKRFQFGPLEWAWRSLTYWQRQSLSRSQ